MRGKSSLLFLLFPLFFCPSVVIKQLLREEQNPVEDKGFADILHPQRRVAKQGTFEDMCPQVRVFALTHSRLIAWVFLLSWSVFLLASPLVINPFHPRQ